MKPLGKSQSLKVLQKLKIRTNTPRTKNFQATLERIEAFSPKLRLRLEDPCIPQSPLMPYKEPVI